MCVKVPNPVFRSGNKKEINFQQNLADKVKAIYKQAQDKILK